MNITLKESENIWKQLLPITFNRGVAEIPLGILTIQQKWEILLGQKPEIEYSEKYLVQPIENQEVLKVFSHWIPTRALAETLANFPKNAQLFYQNELVAEHCVVENPQQIAFEFPLQKIENVWEIFTHCAQYLAGDWEIMPQNEPSQNIEKSNQLFGDCIYIHPTAKVRGAILNAENGGIWIDEGAEIMEGAMIRGPFYLGKNSVVKMGAKIYGATSIGAGCKVGGELSNVVFLGNANKAHDGFLGNSVIGEWCNLGADTNCSNLKNNYGTVDIFSYAADKTLDTGLQFCGLLMGDYSKCGINTMFNTGTVVGICSNIFGGGFPPKHVPPFSWCSVEHTELYKLDKALDTLAKMKARRGLEIGDRERRILTYLYESLEWG